MLLIPMVWLACLTNILNTLPITTLVCHQLYQILVNIKTCFCQIYFLQNQIKVFKVLSSLDGSKACGPDGVSPAVSKQCDKVLTSSLVTLFNLSMEQSKVPTSWKLANVIPVHKKVTGILFLITDQFLY